MAKQNGLMLLLALALSACKKDVAIPGNNSIAIIPNYIPLTIGSYWVYDWYLVDTSGNSVKLNVTDSVYVASDTIIGSDTFAIQTGTNYGSPFKIYVRDSSGYIINPSGGIFLSSINYTDTFYTWYSGNGTEMGFKKMIDIGEIVTVPVGTFRTINAAFVVINLAGSWPCFGKYDIHDNQYAENVGMVRMSFQYTSSLSCKILEGRLISYHIN